MALSDMVVVTGNANPRLAQNITRYLKTRLSPCEVGAFADGETRVQFAESIRDKHLYIIQPLSRPVNTHLFELVLLVDAARRASAASITAVIPYFAYARQDRVASPREPIAAKIVAQILEIVGTTRVVVLDLHAPQIEGFFDIPVEHLHAEPVLSHYLKKKGFKKAVVVSPDIGSVKDAQRFAASLGTETAVIYKERVGVDKVKAIQLIGDVRGKDALIVDDVLSTGGTVMEAASLLKKAGAKNVYAVVVHGVIAPGSEKRIEQSALDGLFVTDTVDQASRKEMMRKLHVVSVAGLLGEAIKRIHEGRSLDPLR